MSHACRLLLMIFCLMFSGGCAWHAGADKAMNWNAGADGVGTVSVGGRVLLSEVVAVGRGADRVTRTGDTLVLEGRFPAQGEHDGLRLQLRHHIGSARHVWMPHLAPESGFVMGDHAFRSPAIVLADDMNALVLVPDLDDVGAGFAAGWRTWMDYDHPSGMITLAAGDYRVEGHVFYRSKPLSCSGQSVRLRLHLIQSDQPEDLANPYGLAARFCWQRWGSRRHAEGGSQRAPLSRYADWIVRWAFSPEGWGDTVWQEFEVNGRPCGGPAFIVDVAQHPAIPVEQRRWREQRSLWNQAWFSTQRCANGLYRYARWVQSADLTRRAQLSTNLALAAPQTNGLFPAVYTTAQPGWRSYSLYKDTPGWDKGRWSNSDRRPAGVTEGACHVLDAAFTARLLLEWSDLVGGDAEATAVATRLADRLCELQLPSGAFPGWVEPDGAVGKTLAEGPESAMGATLLLELSERLPEKQAYRRAAGAALVYLVDGPVAEGRWEDFETYYSCSRWGSDRIGRRIERNGVYKQNTFSPFWCAEAFLAGYRVLGEDRWLAAGRRCMDELSLFQQVWDPPFIAAPCHGGFGVMNADGEWNDARQSLFAPLYMEYYKATGLAEYFERGVAALRASFAMLYCPENSQVKKQYELKHPMFGPESYGFMMENIAHSGPAPADGSAIGPFTIYTWGNGAALSAAVKVRDLYGEVYLDAKRRSAFGIDGCSAEIDGNELVIQDRYGRKEMGVVDDDGRRFQVPLRNGVGRMPLHP